MDKKRHFLKIRIVVTTILVLVFGMSCLFFPTTGSQRGTPETTIPPTDSPVSRSIVTKTPIVIVSSGDAGARRVADSLNFILTGDTTLPSYHLESNRQSPCWVGSAIAQCPQKMSADVQGKDVHFTCTETKPGKNPKTTEMYLIGDQEYGVVDGVVQPAGVSLDSLVWSMWPANTLAIVAIGDTNVSPAGTEDLDGRTADIYTMDGTSTSVGDATGIQLAITAVKGQLWVDQQTGALLKAVLDFQADVHDTAGNPKGSGAGHLEIMISQIGSVTVSLP